MVYNTYFWRRWVFFVYMGVFSFNVAWAYDVQVTGDGYIELHTGPGRGFPVFHIVEHGHNVSILKQKTDWYQVRSERDKIGWVHGEQMANTLTIGAEIRRFETVMAARRQTQRIGVGFAAGIIDDGDAATFNMSYRITKRLFGELTVSQATNVIDNTLLAYVGANIDIFTWAYASVGVGLLETKPTSDTVFGDVIKNNIINAGLGVKVKIGTRIYWQTAAKLHFFTDGEEQYFDLQTGLMAFF